MEVRVLWERVKKEWLPAMDTLLILVCTTLLLYIMNVRTRHLRRGAGGGEGERSGSGRCTL